MMKTYKDHLVVAIASCMALIFFPTYQILAECDQPETPEMARIYFANGMSNADWQAEEGKVALQIALGMNGKSYGLSYNDNENWLAQLLEVYEQRQNESDEFWYWLRNMDQAPQWFRDEYAEKVGRFNDQMVQGDPDLGRHIRQYLADLNSGKKVVIVAHSQGNFYANNAYRHIYLNYPQYRNCIGMVSVATPSSLVQSGGPYTTNPEDLVINLVRNFYPDTLPANVPPYDNPDSLIDHEFVETYLKGYGSRITGQVLQTISSLEQPEKEFECKEPEEVPVIVKTTAASNISTTSAFLNGYVESGKQIAARCIWRKASDGTPSSCSSIFSSIEASGALDTGENFHCIANGLSENTTYNFRVCGREGNRISDGGQKSFKTSIPAIPCGTPLSANGGWQGLSVDFSMGGIAGYANVEFEAYRIPDLLEIWHGGTKIYTTGGFVSGFHTNMVFHDPSKGEAWNIRVYGNSDRATVWNLNISCPNNE